MPDIVSHLTISNIKSGKCAGQCLRDFCYLYGITFASLMRIRVMNQSKKFLIYVKAIDNIVLSWSRSLILLSDRCQGPDEID